MVQVEEACETAAFYTKATRIALQLWQRSVVSSKLSEGHSYLLERHDNVGCLRRKSDLF